MIILVIDCETTGLPKRNNAYPSQLHIFDSSRLLEFAYILYDTATGTKLSTWNKLICPDGFVVGATDIHGITIEMANTGICIEELFDHLESIIDKFECIVSHNIDFDIRVVLSEVYRYKRSALYDALLGKKFLCTMLIGSNAFNDGKYMSLSLLVDRLDLDSFVSHRALPDAEAALNCLIELKKLKETNKKIKFTDWKHDIKNMIN
jgi:DNA polymerase III epsilon subunit-like protein